MIVKSAQAVLQDCHYKPETHSKSSIVYSMAAIIVLGSTCLTVSLTISLNSSENIPQDPLFVLYPDQAEYKSSLHLLKLWTILKSLHEKGSYKQLRIAVRFC